MIFKAIAMKNCLRDTLKFYESETGLPKHEALCKAFILAIKRGIWKPGEKLPTEQELAETYPLSLGTIQRAIRTLVEGGFVTRRRGSGTFVADQHRLLENPLNCRFAGDSGFLSIYSKLLSRRLIGHAGPWSKPLRQQGRSVLRIDREISVGGEFKVLSRFYVDLHRFPSLLTRPAQELATANIKLLIAREYQVAVARIEQVVCVGGLPVNVCQTLGLDAGTSGIRIELLGLEHAGGAVMYQELFIPPNPYRIVVSPEFSQEEWAEGGSFDDEPAHEAATTKGDSHETF
jgi:GntR family transcriptional regulator